MNSEVVLVTPKLAKEWLVKNDGNRNVVQSKVEKYAAMMAAGEWRPNNQGIGFGPNNKLLDGQHRLMAVVRANKSVRMLVVRGLDEQARWTVDAGCKRTIGHVIYMMSGETSVYNVASWCALYMKLVGRSPDYTYPQFTEWRERNAQAIDFVKGEYLSRVRGVRKCAPVAGAIVFAYPTAPEKVEAFARQLRDGEDMPPRSPVLALWRYLSSIRADGEGHRMRHGSDDRVKKTLNALCAHVNGEALERAVVGDRGITYFGRYHGAAPRVAVQMRGRAKLAATPGED